MDLRTIIKKELVLLKESRVRNTQDFINKAKQIYGPDRYIYDKSVYTKAQDPITVECPKHGPFTKKAYSFLDGSGCPDCGIESRASKSRIGTESFIEKSKEIHGDKYDYSKVIYKNNSTPVTIICPIEGHGEFKQQPQSHIGQSAGCPKCANRYMDTDYFIQKSKKIHRGKNYEYDLVDYVNNVTPVKIICPDHGVFNQRPMEHLTGNGCPDCAGNKRSNTESFIEKSKDIHGDIYDYSQVDYKNSSTDVEIICDEHGSFFQKPGKHLSGQGCPDCARENSKYSTEEFIELCKKKHGNKYGYDKTVYTGSLNPVTINCPKHGDFDQVAIEHRRGSGCPDCLESKGELFISKILQDYNVEFEKQKKFEDCKGTHNKRCRRLPFDFFLPQYRTIIEFDGKQHYQPVSYFGGEMEFARIQKYDKIKNDYAERNNFKMVRIPYNTKDDDIIKIIKGIIEG
jgi:very-short-patch-repair endonuclease